VISATAEIEGPCSAVVFTITSPSGETLFPTSASISTYKSGNGTLAEAKFEIADPELWFPHGYGGQPLYRLNAVLGDGVDKSSKTLGIRRMRLVQRALEEQEGLSFFFEVNNVPIFCGGSNWIPADSFIPRISDEKYIQWLELLVSGLQVMVRYTYYSLHTRSCSDRE
jgi:beta-mannosidase